MKIRALGYTSVRLTFKNIDMITDPVEAKEATGTFNKTEGDVVIHTSNRFVGKQDILKSQSLESKVEARDGRDVIEISSPGEYEIGEVFIRRNILQNFYILDEAEVRVVVLGEDCKNTPTESFKSLGDVDVLVVPVGDGDKYMSYEKLEKVISTIDPTYLIPVGGQESASKAEGLKSTEDFIKHFGYANAVTEKILTIAKFKDEEDKRMQVVLLGQ